MLNMFDSGRTYDLDPRSLYNSENKSIKSNLIWVKLNQANSYSEIVPINEFGEHLTVCLN